MRYLLFNIHAHMSSFGNVAERLRRPSDDRPTRSMVLGLVANCLGIDRSDFEALDDMDAAMGFAVATLNPGRSMFDFHTAIRLKRPDKDDRQPQSRRQAQFWFGKADATLTYREYLTDGWYVACLWSKDPAFDLNTVREALNEPARTPFVGRMASPLGLPMDPQVKDAPDPLQAVLSYGAGEKLDRLRALVRAKRNPFWDEDRKPGPGFRLSRLCVDDDVPPIAGDRIRVVDRMDRRQLGADRRFTIRRERVIDFVAVGGR